MKSLFRKIRGFSSPIGGLSWVSDEQKDEARISFREGLVDSLSLFYPSPGQWNIGFESKLHNAVASIKMSAQKYSFFLKGKEKKKFLEAWDAFEAHAMSMTWDDCAAYRLYPTMREENSKDPQSVFYKKLEGVLDLCRET